MAWTDVKIELDKVTTAVDSLSTADGLTAKADTLERVDAAAIVADCKTLKNKIEELARRADLEQEETEAEVLGDRVRVIRKADDVKCVITKGDDGRILNTVHTSEALNKRVIATKNYVVVDKVKKRVATTFVIEELK